MSTSTNNQHHLISYIALRQSLGILGIVFPVVLYVGSLFFGDCSDIQSSISNYYHTLMRDVFVGVLCAFALFLFTYTGYKDSHDNLATNLAGIFALGIAVFPTAAKSPLPPCNCPPNITEPIISDLHFITTALFFLTLTYIAYFLFTKTRDGEEPTPEKIRRNQIYKGSAVVMFICILFIGLYYNFLRSKYPYLVQYNPVFWLESLALWAFGISWIVKGELILKDRSGP